MFKFTLRFLIAATFAISMYPSTTYAETDKPLDISVRAGFGKTFLSNTDPVSGGWVIGGDIRVQVSEHFGIGGTVLYGWASQYSYNNSGASTSQSTDVHTTVFGINPYWVMKKSNVSASFGAIMGAMITSVNTSNYVSPNTSVSSQQFTRVAVGANAAFDLTIGGPVFVTVVPSYVHALGPDVAPGIFQIYGGVGLNF